MLLSRCAFSKYLDIWCAVFLQTHKLPHLDLLVAPPRLCESFTFQDCLFLSYLKNAHTSWRLELNWNGKMQWNVFPTVRIFNLPHFLDFALTEIHIISKLEPASCGEQVTMTLFGVSYLCYMGFAHYVDPCRTSLARLNSQRQGIQVFLSCFFP